MGICMLISALVLFFMAMLSPNITNTTAIIAGSIIAIDTAIKVYIGNTKCKK